MEFGEIAAYAAPVIWFSADEPLLGRRSGTEISIPAAFPFDAPGRSPVVYYRIRRVLARTGREEEPIRFEPGDPARSRVVLRRIAGMQIDYFFYYPFEVGLGGHVHDLESVEILLRFEPASEGNPDGDIRILAGRVIGKAHGLLWYDNTLDSFTEVRYPIHILVEEGKHASCPDANADGRYTPGYDVTRRINDAWGVRDIIRGGSLYSSGFQAWMAKPRRSEHRVFPPLPTDSPVREWLLQGADSGGHAVYELRPFPPADLAAADLAPYLRAQGGEAWPKLQEIDALHEVGQWVDPESFVRTLSLSYRFDGRGGAAASVPLFLLRAFNEPIGAGWITHRVYGSVRCPRKIGWQLQYTASASRWIDPYLCSGVEWSWPERGGVQSHGTVEQGIKLRVNLAHTPLRPLAKIADFWGVRAGLHARGLFPVRDWRVVAEVGAGAF